LLKASDQFVSTQIAIRTDGNNGRILRPLRLATLSPVFSSDGFGPSVTRHAASWLLKVLTWVLLQSQQMKLETQTCLWGTLGPHAEYW